MATPDKSDAELVKDLATAVSIQAQVANRLGLGLMTVAVVGLLPRVPTKDLPGYVDLPFNLGPVEATSYYLVVFLMIVVLAIAFSAAHAQQIRAQDLAHNFIDGIPGDPKGKLGMTLREQFNMLRLPSLNRVAPLAQLLRMQYQFIRKTTGCPLWLKIVTTIYYLLLKLTSMVVYFGMPVFSLFHSYKRTQAVGSLRCLIIIGGMLALLALVHICLSELLHLGKTVPDIWSCGASDVRADETRKKM